MNEKKQARLRLFRLFIGSVTIITFFGTLMGQSLIVINGGFSLGGVFWTLLATSGIITVAVLAIAVVLYIVYARVA